MNIGTAIAVWFFVAFVVALGWGWWMQHLEDRQR